MDLQALFLSSIDELLRVRPDSRRLTIAVSGGRDSMVLLDLCARLANRLPLDLSAIHVNHGLSANAGSWEQHVSVMCQGYGVPLTVRHLQLDTAKGQSPEEQAREARYGCFLELLQPQDVLLTAHHQADQAETVLLNLFRGSGPRGLAGMPQGRSLGDSWVWRPLLDAADTVINDYATLRRLRWVIDESNHDQRYRRNFIRHTLAPLLSSQWPDWQASVSRTAGLCREIDVVTEALAQKSLESVVSDTGALVISALQSMPDAYRSLLVRHWLKAKADRWPSRQLVTTILKQLVNASHDAQPRLEWMEWTIWRESGSIMLDRQGAEIPTLPEETLWVKAADDFFPRFVLPSNGYLEMRRVSSSGMVLPSGQFRVSYRQGGEKIRLPGRPRRLLKKILQESGIPVSQRQRLPLLWIDEHLAWVAGVGFDEQFMSDGQSPGWLPVWLKESL